MVWHGGFGGERNALCGHRNPLPDLPMIRVLVAILLAFLLLIAATVRQTPTAFTAIALRVTSNACAIDSLSVEWWLGEGQRWIARSVLPDESCIILVELPTAFEVPPQARIMTIRRQNVQQVKAV